MSVVRWRRQDCNPSAGTPLPPLHVVERPPKTLWKGVGKAMCLKDGGYRQVAIPVLCSITEQNQAVMDFLAVTDGGEFQPE
jgi:hypothetical protein